VLLEAHVYSIGVSSDENHKKNSHPIKIAADREYDKVSHQQ